MALHRVMISSNPKSIENNREAPHKCEVVKYTIMIAIIGEKYAIISWKYMILRNWNFKQWNWTIIRV